VKLWGHKFRGPGSGEPPELSLIRQSGTVGRVGTGMSLPGRSQEEKTRLQYFGHVVRADNLCIYVLRGIVAGKRRRGRPRRRWTDDVKQWTGTRCRVCSARKARGETWCLSQWPTILSHDDGPRQAGRISLRALTSKRPLFSVEVVLACMRASNDTLFTAATFTPPMQTSLLCAACRKAGLTSWKYRIFPISVGVRSRQCFFS